MEDRIVTITSCHYARAQLIKARLEAAGIECFLTHINLVQPGVATGVRVKIQEKDAETAGKIIEEIMGMTGEEKHATIQKLKRIRRILVPVDFSEYSDNACEYALGLAVKLKAEIKLIYSYFNPLVGSEPYLENNAVAFHFDQILGDIAKEAKSQISNLKKDFGKKPVKWDLLKLKSLQHWKEVFLKMLFYTTLKNMTRELW